MSSGNLHRAEGILFTDQYQLTMAQLYFRMGLHEIPAQFDFFFRSLPDYGTHRAGFCINAGLQSLLEWMSDAQFQDLDISFLRSQRGESGNPIFHTDFLSWLKENGNFERLSICAVPEGRVVHPHVPLVVVKGPLAVSQILESALLNKLNYQILVATKAARIRQSGYGQLLLEFGLRRGQDKGANAGTRAALIGGADYSSNVGISHELGVAPKGTHAHSMVQMFISLGEGELEAFRAYAEVYPDDCLLLVDTVDTLNSGVPNALKVFEELKRKGHDPLGIRLDSGDLAYLSIQAAKQLDQAGFPDVKIVLSNQLDELLIAHILTRIRTEAPRHGVDSDRLVKRLVYGVGTHLITSRGSPALDGVYKLVAVRKDGTWVPTLKRSDSPEKSINPAGKACWRLYEKNGQAYADLLSLESENLKIRDSLPIHDSAETGIQRTLTPKELAGIEKLLIDVITNGKLVYECPSLDTIRSIREADIQRLQPESKSLVSPRRYPVYLTDRLWKLKQELMAKAVSPEITP